MRVWVLRCTYTTHAHIEQSTHTHTHTHTCNTAFLPTRNRAQYREESSTARYHLSFTTVVTTGGGRILCAMVWQQAPPSLPWAFSGLPARPCLSAWLPCSSSTSAHPLQHRVPFTNPLASVVVASAVGLHNEFIMAVFVGAQAAVQPPRTWISRCICTSAPACQRARERVCERVRQKEDVSERERGRALAIVHRYARAPIATWPRPYCYLATHRSAAPPVLLALLALTRGTARTVHAALPTS